MLRFHVGRVLKSEKIEWPFCSSVKRRLSKSGNDRRKNGPIFTQLLFSQHQFDFLPQKLPWNIKEGSCLYEVFNFWSYRTLTRKIIFSKSLIQLGWNPPLYSEQRRVTSGVPQGSIVGPLLFMCLIDAVAACTSSKTAVRIFADDIAIYRVVHKPEDTAEFQLDLDAVYS